MAQREPKVKVFISVNYWRFLPHKGWVFTSDGVVVGVVIRSIGRYDEVKIKTTELEGEHRFSLWFCGSRYSEICIVGVASKSEAIYQSQCWIPGLVVRCFFHFFLRLRLSSCRWVINDGVVNGIGRNGNVLILLTPIPSSSWLRLWLSFSILTT